MSVVIFVLLRLAPGNIVDILFATGGYVSEADKQAIMKELGIDRPLWIQYWDWIHDMATGNLGKSYRYDLPTWQIIKPLIPVTMELAILSTIVAVLLGSSAPYRNAIRFVVSNSTASNVELEPGKPTFSMFCHITTKRRVGAVPSVAV